MLTRLKAAGGIISASLLSQPGASGYYKGGLTVRPSISETCFKWQTFLMPFLMQLYTLPSRIAFGKYQLCFLQPSSRFMHLRHLYSPNPTNRLRTALDSLLFLTNQIHRRRLDRGHNHQLQRPNAPDCQRARRKRERKPAEHVHHLRVWDSRADRR